MRPALPVIALPLLIAASPQPATIEPGIYTNEEQVYFEKDAGRAPPPYVAFDLPAGKPAKTVALIDSFGEPTGKSIDARSIVSASGGRVVVTLSGGQTTELRRARPVTCWAAVRKEKPKADGSPDWHFAQNVKLHDQGGRAWLGKDAADARPAIIRMRYVTWAGSRSASNRPSLVLYVHTPDQPDSAVSYAWADEGAARVGINLRWMQASCTIDGAENPSQVDQKNFRG
jgi:hypothetical protein